ncbi:MAG: DUF4309 domain-containing protein, partial [Bacillota bacterium]|nr:DUF4309 domain-containing protein [Bacillota bacterium]
EEIGKYFKISNTSGETIPIQKSDIPKVSSPSYKVMPNGQLMKSTDEEKTWTALGDLKTTGIKYAQIQILGDKILVKLNLNNSQTYTLLNSDGTNLTNLSEIKRIESSSKPQSSEAQKTANPPASQTQPSPSQSSPTQKPTQQVPSGNGNPLSLAAQGVIPGLDFKMGDLGKSVLDKLGTPESEGTFEGSYYLLYKDVTYFVSALNKNDVPKAPIIGIALRTGNPFGIQIGKTLLKDVASILGKPYSEPAASPEDGDWGMRYQLGNYKVFFTAKGLNSPVQVLQLLEGN